jgi:hypothetical protein
MLTLTRDQFAALGRELVNAHIAAFGEAVAGHSLTEGVPAPADHPLIERIVREHGGQYAVADPPPAALARDFGAEIDALSDMILSADSLPDLQERVSAIALARLDLPAAEL